MTANNTSSEERPNRNGQGRPSRIKRYLRFAGYGLSTLIVAVFSINLLWKMSGDGEWELEIEREGVKVYSLKEPGSYNKQFKAVMRAEYSLNHLIAGLIENATVEVCREHIPNCIDMEVIEPWSEKTMSDTVLWKLELPPPFLPRETVIRSQVSQDPLTKALTVDIVGAPNSTPRNAGTVRVTHFQNRWRYIPLDDGAVEIEFLQDIDMGGMFPDFLMNLGGAEETYKFIHDQLPSLLDRDILKNTTYDFIKEPEK